MHIDATNYDGQYNVTGYITRHLPIHCSPPYCISDAMIAMVMLINALVLICNIIVLRMAGQHEERMSDKLRRTIFDCLGRLVCCKSKSNSVHNSKTQNPMYTPTAPMGNEITCRETSNNDTPVPNVERASVDRNLDLHTLSKGKKKLSVSLAHPQRPLADLSFNGSLGVQDKEFFQEEWQQAARILDRFFGICCFLLMFVTVLGMYFNYG